MKKTTTTTPTPSQPVAASTAGRRAQPVRQTRTNPARNSAKAGAGSGLARSSGDGHHDGQKTKKPPGFCPAITHFTDSITALPKEVVRHFGLLKEVDAKLYGPEHTLRELTDAALNTPAPGPASHGLVSTSSVVAPQPSTNPADTANAGAIAGGDASTTLVPSRRLDEQSDWARRQLFFNLRVTLTEILGSLDEKNHVIQTATQALSRQLSRCESSYQYIDDEISEEARYGSLTHWAYAEKPGSKTNGTSNERPRREVGNASNLAGVGALMSEEAAASRSESRREAMLAKKNRLQASDSVAPESTLGRQRGAASTPSAAATVQSKKGNGPAKSKKPAEVATATVGASTNNAAAGPELPPTKRRRTEKAAPSRTASAAATLESPLLELSEMAQPTARIDARSPRSTPATEGPKKRVRSGATTAGNPRKRNNTNTTNNVHQAASTAASPSLASSPVQTHFAVASKDPPAGSPVPQPAQQRPATSRGRQESGQSVVQDVASNGRRRPSSSASNKLQLVNGASTNAVDTEQAPPSAKSSHSEAKVPAKGTTKPHKESSNDSRNGRATGDTSRGGGGGGPAANKAKDSTERTAHKEDTEGSPRLHGTPVGGNSTTVTSIITSTAAPRGGGKSSKTSTPVTATFPEMHRSKSSRGADGTSAPKRSHKKGGGSGAGPPQHGHSMPPGSPVAPADWTATAIKNEHPDAPGPGPGGTVQGNRRGHPDEAPADEEEEEEEGSNALEPRYCYCNQVSYGSMVACDAKDCPREWFHLSCVGLTRAPGKNELWYCDECKENIAKHRPHQPHNESSNGNGSRGGSVR